MADFENACAARRIPLQVLPPESPKLDGGVERANSSWRYGFYACYDLPHELDAINDHVDSLAHLYNPHRPHGALRGQAPAAYLATLTAQEGPTVSST
jgi:transposase InsO family protein